MFVTDELHKAITSVVHCDNPITVIERFVNDGSPTVVGLTVEMELPENWTFTPPDASTVSRRDVAKVLAVAHTLLNWVESRCEPDCGICAVKREVIEELERKLFEGEGQPAWR